MPDQEKLTHAVAHLEAAENIFREMIEAGLISEQEVDFVVDRLCAMADLVDRGNFGHDPLDSVTVH